MKWYFLVNLIPRKPYPNEHVILRWPTTVIWPLPFFIAWPMLLDIMIKCPCIDSTLPSFVKYYDSSYYFATDTISLSLEWYHWYSFHSRIYLWNTIVPNFNCYIPFKCNFWQSHIKISHCIRFTVYLLFDGSLVLKDDATSSETPRRGCEKIFGCYLFSAPAYYYYYVV